MPNHIHLILVIGPEVSRNDNLRSARFHHQVADNGRQVAAPTTVQIPGRNGGMHMKAVFYTNKGCVRKGNEDALFAGGCAVHGTNMTAPSYIEIDADKEIFCVIDGLGGHFGGAEAARITAQAFQSVVNSGKNGAIGKIWLESVLQKAFEGMREAARHSPELGSMGVTLAGAVIDRGKKSILTFNLGDCRVYRFRGGFLDKLTHDHSRVQELCDSGEISEEEMRTHPKKNIVTAGIFVNDSSAPEFFCREFQLKDGDKFFACSDGVWEAMPIDEIEKSLSGDDMLAACSELQKELFLAECGDNVSFVFAAK